MKIYVLNILTMLTFIVSSCSDEFQDERTLQAHTESSAEAALTADAYSVGDEEEETAALCQWTLAESLTHDCSIQKNGSRCYINYHCKSSSTDVRCETKTKQGSGTCRSRRCVLTYTPAGKCSEPRPKTNNQDMEIQFSDY